jgi:uncharacterized protein YcaQ
MPDSLSIRQARRLALAAQGLSGMRATRPASAAALRSALSRVGAVQIDSVNVVARSHELALAARAGAHDPAAFDRLVYRRRAGFEHWGHAASFLPVESFRWFLPRMHAVRLETGKWFLKARSRHPEWYPRVLERIRAEGPLAASAFREPAAGRRGPWWDWTPAKAVLEDLFAQGVLLVHDRVRFERRYDLAERVMPGALEEAVPSPEEAALALTLLAARALGVATAADLADYYRLPAAETRLALAEATASGLLRRVGVEGWSKPAYLPADALVPGRVQHPPLLLSPFDSLVWSRERTERLFGFRYVLELYVPPARRQHGYYTMPVLMGEQLVARVDPKFDRPTGRLLLRGVIVEDGVPTAEAVAAAAAAAGLLAAHLGAVAVEPGEAVPAALAGPLRAALAESGVPAAPAGRARAVAASGTRR